MTISKERIEAIAYGSVRQSQEEGVELARMVLSAMDSSESVELPLDYLQGHKDGLEWAAQLAEANHPETGDWLYDDPIELAKAIRKGPDMPPSQPVPVVPDIDELRLAFEAAERESGDGFNLHKYGIGYADDETQGRWDTWLACRAAMLNGGKS